MKNLKTICQILSIYGDHAHLREQKGTGNRGNRREQREQKTKRFDVSQTSPGLCLISLLQHPTIGPNLSPFIFF